jgi:hypothetical protein
MANTERTETPEMNRRINTLIMRGLSATDATTQAHREMADHPVWVKVCRHPGCVITRSHSHGGIAP